MKQRLSTLLTFPYKIFIGLLIGFSLYLLIFEFQALRWLVAGLGALIAYFLVGPYKRVIMLNGALYVSNYLREIRIPFDQVQSVSGPWSWKSNTPEIVIKLKTNSSFGQKIKFAPKLMKSREIAESLRQQVERARD